MMLLNYRQKRITGLMRGMENDVNVFKKPGSSGEPARLVFN